MPDYRELAKQYGGVVGPPVASPAPASGPVDYRALAQQYGGTVEEPSLLRRVAPTAARVSGGILGTVLGIPGGPVGMAAGGALGASGGEYLAQQLEKSAGQRDTTSLSEVGIQGVLGAIPGLGPGKTVLGTIGKSALQGGVLNAGAETARSVIERGELPDAARLATAAGAGAVFGGAFGGALDVAGRGLRRLRPRAVAGPEPPAGLLTAGAYTAAPDGRVARPGVDLEMAPAPDGSFVRSVPAEYARREVRGLLPPGPRFVASESGDVVPLERAGELAAVGRRADAPDPSGVRSVPAAVVDREIDATVPARDSVRVRQFSSDPAATDAPFITPDDRRMLERMREDLLTFTPQRGRLVKDPHDPNSSVYAHGGPGSPVGDDIRVISEQHVGNAEIVEAIDDLLAGKVPSNRLHTAALDAARGVAEGRSGYRGPILPWAETHPQATAAVDDDGFAAFARAFDEPEPVSVSGGREPGEEGFTTIDFAGRLGPALLGGAAGYATGDTQEDRIARAALGAGVGAAGAGLLLRRLGADGTASSAGPRMVEGLARRGAGNGPAVPPGVSQRAQGAAPDDALRGFEPFVRQFTNPLVREGVAERLQANAGFAAQRRGVVNRAEQSRLAERVAVDVSRALPRGTALNAEQVTAYGRAVSHTMSEVQRLAAVVNAGRATDADLLALQAAHADHAVVLASMVGARAEAGRALAAFRALNGAWESGDVNLIRAASRGVRDDAERIARLVAEAGEDPLRRYDVLRQSMQPSFTEKARSYYYANILSGVKTHERNFVGNLANLASHLVVHPVAAGIDAVKSGLTGAPRTVRLDEMPAQLAGAVAGLERGARDFVFTMRHGVSPSALSQTLSRAEQGGAFDAPRVELPGGGANPLNYPGRLLDAADSFFRSINTNAELYGLAFTQARNEGLTGDRLAARVADLRTGVSPAAAELQQQAAAFSQRAVFQEQPGAFAGTIQRAARQFPALSFVVPFIKTPANILRQGLEFSPVGAGMAAARQGGRAGTQAQARAAVGTAAAGVLAWLAASGRISGSGPRNESDRAALMESGWRPNSIKIGDRWVSYSLFQPVSVQAAIVANAFEAWRDAGGEDASMAAFSTVMRSIDSFLDQSFLSGLFDLVQAVSRSDSSPEAAKRLAGRTAHSLTPLAGLQRTVRDAVDPLQRKPEGFTEAVKANIPGLSSSVPARVDRFGEDVRKDGGPVRRALDPLNTSTVKNDSISAELQRLQAAGFRVAVTLPDDAVTYRGERLELDADQARQVDRARGRAVRFALERAMNDPRYQRLSDERRANYLRDRITAARRMATTQQRRRLVPELRQRSAAR